MSPAKSARLVLPRCVVLALLLSACGNAADQTAPASEPKGTTVGTVGGSTKTQRPSGVSESTVPDMVGKTLTEAYAALAAAGITDIAKPAERPQLGTSGVVLDQVPQAGSRNPGTVSLTISIPLPDMPNYMGKSSKEAISELKSWGIDATVTTESTRELPVGEVIETTPKPGDRIGSQVKLVVAESPTSIELTSKEAPLVKSSSGYTEDDNQYPPETGSIAISGTNYEKALRSSSRGKILYPNIIYWDFNASKDWGRFEAIAGVDDSSDSEMSALFQIIGDGKVLWEQPILFGQSVPVALDITGVLRLRLRIESRRDGAGYLGWANPTLIAQAE
jgi:hypothetical protein